MVNGALHIGTYVSNLETMNYRHKVIRLKLKKTRQTNKEPLLWHWLCTDWLVAPLQMTDCTSRLLHMFNAWMFRCALVESSSLRSSITMRLHVRNIQDSNNKKRLQKTMEVFWAISSFLIHLHIAEQIIIMIKFHIHKPNVLLNDQLLFITTYYQHQDASNQRSVKIN